MFPQSIPPKDERTVVYPWALKHLKPPPSKVLDVGCSSIIPEVLVGLGYEVYGIDINEQWLPKIEGFRGSCQDIRRTTFPNKFFDQVTNISTLEHVGMDWYYNKWLDVEQGDFEAMKETGRILKTGGHLLLTIPYGSEYKPYQALRVYDDKRISRLLEGFETTSIEYFIDENGEWKIANKQEALKIGCPQGYVHATVCILSKT